MKTRIGLSKEIDFDDELLIADIQDAYESGDISRLLDLLNFTTEDFFAQGAPENFPYVAKSAKKVHSWKGPS